MQDFIQMVTKQLNIPAGNAQAATGGLLNLVQEKLGGGDFQKLLGGVPGIQEAMRAPQPQAKAAGGLGGLLGQAASMLPGNLGAAANVAQIFQNAGIDKAQAPSFIQTLFDYLKGKIGAGNMSGLLAKLPEIQKFLK